MAARSRFNTRTLGFGTLNNRTTRQPKDDEVLVSAAHSERMLSLLESGVGDLTILAGKEKAPIRVQKMFLTTASPVFRKMYGNDRDNADGNSGAFVQTLELPDMSKEEVMMFLKFIYAGTKPDKVESALSLIRAAKTYEIPDLGKHCAKLLETRVSNESSLHIYEQARLCNNEHLMKSAMEYICKNAVNILELKQFEEVSVEALAQILQEDALAVFDEAYVFDAVMRWAQAEIKRRRALSTPSNIRSVLENVIRFIRFPQMTPYEFTSRVITSQALSTDEIVVASLYYNVPEYQRCSLPRGLFNASSRHYVKPSLDAKEYKVSHKNDVLISDRHIIRKSSVANQNHSCSVRFKVNSQVWIRRVHVDFTFTPPTQFYDRSAYTNTSMYKHKYDVFPFNPTDLLLIAIEDVASKQVLVQNTVQFTKTEATGPDSCSILTAPLGTDLRIKENTKFCVTFRVTSNMLKDRRYGCTRSHAVIPVVCEGASGQQEKVVFEFEETEAKSFFVGLSFDFLII